MAASPLIPRSSAAGSFIIVFKLWWTLKLGCIIITNGFFGGFWQERQGEGMKKIRIGGYILLLAAVVIGAVGFSKNECQAKPRHQFVETDAPFEATGLCLKNRKKSQT